MKGTLFYSLLITILIFSCTGNQEKQSEGIKKDSMPSQSTKKAGFPLLDINAIQDKFKYHNLDSFEIDSFQWEERHNYYTVVDSLTNPSIWQDEKNMNYVPSVAYTGRNYYYSLQNAPKGLKAYTILKEDEGCSCSIIYYNVYTTTGKLTGSFTAAASGTDGGWSFCSYGKFINDTTYLLTSIESEFEGIDTLANKEEIVSDSSIYQYTITTLGKITEKKLKEFKGIKSYINMPIKTQIK